MRRWLLLLGGPIIWAAHFALIYTISSISVQASGDTGALARVLIVGSGAVGIGAGLIVLWVASRMKCEEPFEHFWRSVAIAGAVFGVIAVFWQSLPGLAPI